MKRTFGRSEKVKAASRVALEKLRSLSSRELLAVGAKHTNSDISIMLTESAADYRDDDQEVNLYEFSEILTISCKNLWHERYRVFKDVYAQGFNAAREQLVALELSNSYKLAGAVHAHQIQTALQYDDHLEYSTFICANDGVPVLNKCVAA